MSFVKKIVDFLSLSVFQADNNSKGSKKNKNFFILHIISLSGLSIFIFLIGLYLFIDFTSLTLFALKKVRPSNVHWNFKGLEVRSLTSIKSLSTSIEIFSGKSNYSVEINNLFLSIHPLDLLFFNNINSNGTFDSVRITSTSLNADISSFHYQINPSSLESQVSYGDVFFPYKHTLKINIPSIFIQYIPEVPFIGQLEQINGEVSLELEFYKDKIDIKEGTFLLDIGEVHVSGDVQKRKKFFFVNIIISIELSDAFIVKQEGVILLLKSQGYLLNENRLEANARGNINSIKWTFKSSNN